MLNKTRTWKFLLVAFTLLSVIECRRSLAQDTYKTLLERGAKRAEVEQLYKSYKEKNLNAIGDQSEEIAKLSGDATRNDSLMLVFLSNGHTIRSEDVNHECLPPAGVWAFSDANYQGTMRQFPADCQSYQCVDLSNFDGFEIRSLKIGAKVQIQLFDEPDFVGDSAVFWSDRANLSIDANSMKVRTPPRIDFVTLSKYSHDAAKKAASFRIHLSGANIDEGAVIRFGATELSEASIEKRLDNSTWLGLGKDIAQAGHGLDPTYYAFPIYHYDSIVADVKNVKCGKSVSIHVSNADGQTSNTLQLLIPTPDTLDSDGDGLLDTWENGKVDGLDLTALRANPLRKDIYVEVDRMIVENRVWSDFAETDYPRDAVFGDVETLFGQAPIINPDGSIGISIHIDYGQDQFENSGRGKGGTKLPWKRYIGFNSAQQRNIKKKKAGKDLIPEDQYADAKALWRDPQCFDSDRRKVFRYCVFGDQQWRSRSTGGGKDNSIFFMSLGVCRLRAIDHNYQMGVFVHELGHTLGLSHTGKSDSYNYKPNFNSLMNYTFTFSGHDIDGRLGPMKGGLAGNQVYAYSEGMRADLNEASLREALGVGNHYWHDWNGNKVLDRETVRTSARSEVGYRSKSKSWKPKVMHDESDWANIRFKIPEKK